VRRNVLGDADDRLDAGVDGFIDGVGREPGGNEIRVVFACVS